MKTWKKPEVKTIGNQLIDLSENDVSQIDGGGTKIGVCFIIGLGGDLDTLESPVLIGLCYVVGI